MRILIKILHTIWWVLESQWWVVREHKAGLEKCKEAGSPTAAAVLVWAPLMCFPQWVIAPLFGLHWQTLSIFFARMMAMCIARKLDDKIPMTRAIGLCHLLTFGPILFLILSSDFAQTDNAYWVYFVWSQITVISICLFLDARDLFFHSLGHPYPCYIRDGVLGNKIDIMDERARVPVSWRSRLIGP